MARSADSDAVPNSSSAAEDSEAIDASSAMTATADSTHDPCRLLALPTELQVHICEMLLIRQRAILVPVDAHIARRPSIEPQVLNTTRAIRAETLPIFYGGNAFYAIGCQDMMAWLRGLPGYKLRLLENVQAFGHDYWRSQSDGFGGPKSQLAYATMAQLQSEYARG
ncbi:hypothetical protein LTR53_009236 [Teratosphaeriaceae sp. CCFEE 6253]|nr:hypothetical protein LTR53_009236 [Teratosphaeriaceae sp. CCFEE 6253]